MDNLEKEVEKLKTELETSRLEIKRLQEREQELADRYGILKYQYFVEKKC